MVSRVYSWFELFIPTEGHLIFTSNWILAWILKSKYCSMLILWVSEHCRMKCRIGSHHLKWSQSCADTVSHLCLSLIPGKSLFQFRFWFQRHWTLWTVPKHQSWTSCFGILPLETSHYLWNICAAHSMRGETWYCAKKFQCPLFFTATHGFSIFFMPTRWTSKYFRRPPGAIYYDRSLIMYEVYYRYYLSRAQSVDLSQTIKH